MTNTIYNNGLTEIDYRLSPIDNVGLLDRKNYLSPDEIKAKYDELYKMVGYISLELKSNEDISLDAKVIDAVIRHYKEYQKWAGVSK